MKKVCSFCGRGEKDVRLLITGMNGFICDECVEQAHDCHRKCPFWTKDGELSE